MCHRINNQTVSGVLYLIAATASTILCLFERLREAVFMVKILGISKSGHLKHHQNHQYQRK